MKTHIVLLFLKVILYRTFVRGGTKRIELMGCNLFVNKRFSFIVFEGDFIPNLCPWGTKSIQLMDCNLFVNK